MLASSSSLIATEVLKEPPMVLMSDCFELASNPIDPACTISTYDMDQLVRAILLNMMAVKRQFKLITLRAEMDSRTGLPHEIVNNNLNISRAQLFNSRPEYPVCCYFITQILTAIGDPILGNTMQRTGYADDIVMLRNYIRINQPEFAIMPYGELFLADRDIDVRIGGTARYIGMEKPVKAMVGQMQAQACCPGS